jgi:prepilin-type N-terminal cleavage/methylation domain-containing protein
MKFFSRGQWQKCAGFTLVETIVVVALFTIISLAVLESIVMFYRVNWYTIAQADQVSTARQGMDQLVRDLREMTFSDDGTFPLVVTEGYRVGFYSDIDRDDSVEYVEYRLSTSTVLEKRIYNATGTPPVYHSTGTPDSLYTVSEYVQNNLQSTPVFVYYEINGNPATATTTITDIRYVELSIIVNIDPIRDPGEFMLRSSASLRNLKNTE